MRVDSYNQAGVNPTSVEKTAETTAAQQKATAAQAQTREDSVELSGLSKAVSESGTDQARLDRLRRAVASGSYKVAAEQLSRRIVDAALKQS